MNKITNSGIYYEESGQLVLVTQGLGGYTLVANTKILFRLYLDLSATSCVTVLATVTYKVFGFSIKKSFVIPSGSLLIENSGPLGSSVGILFTGDIFPFPSSPIRYSVEFNVYGNPSSVPHFGITELVFLMPGRLRLLIHNLAGTAPWGTKIEANFAWLIDMFQSLERLAAMLPVRDGIKFGLTHADTGLCYAYGENIDPWPAVCPSGNPPPCNSGLPLLTFRPHLATRTSSAAARRSANPRQRRIRASCWNSSCGNPVGPSVEADATRLTLLGSCARGQAAGATEHVSYN